MQRFLLFGVFVSLQSLTAQAVALPTTLTTSAFKAPPTFASYPSIFPRADDEDSATCGGNPSFSQCGSSFPSNFCCNADTTCVQLNTSRSNAVLCCPDGMDCSVITPVTCEPGAQNATTMPRNMIHSDPTVELETCGSACCPMGYQCQGGACYAVQDPASTSSVVSASFTATTASIAVSAPASTSSGSSTETAGTAEAQTEETNSVTDPNNGGRTHDDGQGFSGRSFAAGFLPGVFIGGVLVAMLLYFYLFRKKRNVPYANDDDEKHRTRDQLTSLGPSPALSYRPTMHGRSISEPVADGAGTHRTDFARGTPPRMQPFDENVENPYDLGSTTVITSISGEKAAATPKSAVSRLTSKLWSPSDIPSNSPAFIYEQSTPKPTQSPLPAHLKRGTLSVLPLFQKSSSSTPSSKNKVTPIRELRKQRSERSLHRRMTKEAGPGSARDSRRSASGRWLWPMKPNHLRTPSQEEIMIGVDRSGDNSYVSPDQSRRPQVHQQGQQSFPRPRAASVASIQSSHFEDVSPTSPTFLGGGTYSYAPAPANHNHIQPQTSNSKTVYPYPCNTSVENATPTRQPLHPSQHTTALTTPPASPTRPAPAAQPGLGSPFSPNTNNNGAGTYPNYRPSPPAQPPSIAKANPTTNGITTIVSPKDNKTIPNSYHTTQNSTTTINTKSTTALKPPQTIFSTPNLSPAQNKHDQRMTQFGDIMQQAGVLDEVARPVGAVPALPRTKYQGVKGSGGGGSFGRLGSRRGRG